MLLLFISSISIAQSPPKKFSYLSTNEGLSDPSVGSIYQDHYGLIWIGTRGGLNCYDGEKMTVYKSGDFGLANDYIYDVKGTNNDSLIWLGTREGVVVFDRFKKEFRSLPTPKNSPATTVIEILPVTDNDIWIASFDGLVHFEAGNLTYYKSDSTDSSSLSDNAVLGLLKVDNKLFVGTYSGLNILDLTTMKFQNLSNNDDTIFKEAAFYVQSLYERNNGEIWMSAFEEYNGGVLLQLFPDGRIVKHINEVDNDKSLMYNYSILSIEEDANDRLWIGSNGAGISIFDDVSSTFQNITYDAKNDQGLNDIDVWELFRDNKGTMWVGTDGGGINLFNSSYNRFTTVQNNPFDLNSINSNQILSFEDTKEYLWLGTNAATGLVRVNKKNGKVKNYPYTEDFSISLYDNTVYDILEVNESLWITSYSGNLSKLNSKTNEMDHFFGKDLFSSDYFSTIILHQNQLYLGAGSGGVNVFDLSTKKSKIFPIPEEDKYVPIDHMALKENVLWIATEKGLKLFDVQKREYLRVKERLQKTVITYIHHAVNDTWIGTNNGLIRLSDNEMFYYRVEQGLSDNVVQGITSSDPIIIWVTTKRGLNRINVTNNQIVNFYKEDGLQDNLFNHRSIEKGLDDTIYIGGNNGYNSFSPNEIVVNEELEKPLFLSVKIIEEDTISEQNLLNQKELHLSYFQSTFNLDFFIPSFSHRNKQKFKYRIIGLNNQFFDLGNKSEINVTSLGYGDYTFEVFATNSDGIWSDEPATINISIEAPFWLRWYAFVVYAIMFLGVFFVRDKYQKIERKRLEKIVADRTFKINEQKEEAEKDSLVIEQQSEKLKELDQVKTKFFSNISHEFRTPLTLIQGPIDSILLGKADSEQTVKKNLLVAQRNVNALRGLIDEILEFNKMEMGDLNLQYRSVLLKEYLDELCQGYQVLAAEQKVHFIESFETLGELRLELPIMQVERIIHNLVSNALKHSPQNTEVKLEVTYENELLSFSVLDHGPGIAKEELDKVFDRFYQTKYGKSLAHSTGLGLSYVKEISEILNGNISVSSEEGNGATFTFSMKAIRSENSGDVEIKEGQEDLAETVTNYPYPNNKILVVEDNHELSDYVVQVLGDQFVTKVAENGQAAIDVMDDFNPDLIISDIMMPVMDGMELLSKLKSHDTWKYKSVMMLTAKTGQEVKLEALSLGLDDYLTKPFSPTELEIRVRNILRNQHERSQWLLQNDEIQNEVEDPLINGLVAEIERNMDNNQFGVLSLSNHASLSDRQLTRVVKKSTGLTPASLIKEVKLSRAKQYLESKTYRTVAEVCYAVGFEKPSYFSTIYFERYGKKPSSYFQ